MKKQIKVCIKEYMRKYYSDLGKPNADTIRRRCRKGEIKNAIKEGRNWYFIVDQEDPNKAKKKP